MLPASRRSREIHYSITGSLCHSLAPTPQRPCQAIGNGGIGRKRLASLHGLERRCTQHLAAQRGHRSRAGGEEEGEDRDEGGRERVKRRAGARERAAEEAGDGRVGAVWSPPVSGSCGGGEQDGEDAPVEGGGGATAAPLPLLHLDLAKFDSWRSSGEAAAVERRGDGLANT
ncbi:hypothetical protein EE612_026054 [Oryza sativa]|nr:hypothetical protein EE612_026054 [Oryza sativa]